MLNLFTESQNEKQYIPRPAHQYCRFLLVEVAEKVLKWLILYLIMTTDLEMAYSVFDYDSRSLKWLILYIIMTTHFSNSSQVSCHLPHPSHFR